MSDNIAIVANRIRDLRNKKSLTQKDLAERMNQHTNRVTRYESGKVDMQMSTFFAIAKALETDPKDLLPGNAPITVQDELIEFVRVNYLTDKEMRNAIVILKQMDSTIRLPIYIGEHAPKK